MVQHRGGAGFLLEPLAVGRVRGNRQLDHLDGGVAAQAEVASPVHLSHTASAEEVPDGVPSQAAPDQRARGARDQLVGRFEQRRALEKGVSGAFEPQQRRDFLTKRVIVATGRVEKRGARLWMALERFVIKALDLDEPTRVPISHGARSPEGARPSRNASRASRSPRRRAAPQPSLEP